MTSNKPIGKNVRIGHVHLKVADLERALDFYCSVLGFELTTRFGSGAAFVSAEDTTIIFRSQHLGKSQEGDRRRRPEQREFTIWPSSIQRAPSWRKLCGAFCAPA